ncbi:MAG TPA: hypothetical protein VGS57_06065 [Thermoanaerobaculia bacterium]|jgi:hypothetical protein|nr:hypothetical protein [Thermoanaerobaculia bacterium]
MRKIELRSSVRLVLCLLVVLLAAGGPLAAADKMTRSGFNADMRKLWEDHITWTRLFLVEATAGLPSKDATTQRLLQNQTDIGNAIKPFYGDAAGTKLTALLRDHILIAADLVTTAAAGDTAKKDAASQRWLANADEIAAFLSGANPKNWPAADAKKMMHEHLSLTTNEVVAHLGKDWKADVAAYDAVHAQILHMADMLSSGIEAQFPNKFHA